MRRTGKTTGQPPQWPPRPARGGCHGQAMVRPMAVVARVFPGCAVFLRVPLRLPTVFALFCLYIAMYLDIQRHPIHSIAITFSIFHSFRLVLERERGSGEELRGFHTGLRSKDGNAFLDELFFPVSFLFSI